LSADNPPESVLHPALASDAPDASRAALSSPSSVISPMHSIVAAQNDLTKRILRARCAHVRALDHRAKASYAHSCCMRQVLWLPRDSDGAWLQRDNGM
jgi:hypothetical protein